MKAFLDTGFLLTLLSHRSGAAVAWDLLRRCQAPAMISSLQLFFIRHGLDKTLFEPNAEVEVHEVCVRAIKLLDWLIQQEVVQAADVDYPEVISLSEDWARELRAPMPSLLLIRVACAAVSGASGFFSFDPRTRALAKASGLKIFPEKL